MGKTHNNREIARGSAKAAVQIVTREMVHAPQAVSAGVPADAVEAIRVGKTPKFVNPGEDTAYRSLTELLRNHKVSDATYERLYVIIGTRQMVELTVLAGHYTNVAMTLVAHHVPMRADLPPIFPPPSK